MALSLRQSITANTLSAEQVWPGMNELRTDIHSEQIRAKAVEAANRADILTEEARAMAAEASTQSQVESAQASLTGEITRAVLVDVDLDQRLTEETTRAVNADAALDQRITQELAAEVIRASSEEASISLAVNTERNRGLAAESFLQSGIDGLNQEINVIIEGGGTLSMNISTETARAMTAENAI